MGNAFIRIPVNSVITLQVHVVYADCCLLLASSLSVTLVKLVRSNKINIIVPVIRCIQFEHGIFEGGPEEGSSQTQDACSLPCSRRTLKKNIILSSNTSPFLRSTVYHCLNLVFTAKILSTQLFLAKHPSMYFIQVQQNLANSNSVINLLP